MTELDASGTADIAPQEITSEPAPASTPKKSWWRAFLARLPVILQGSKNAAHTLAIFGAGLWAIVVFRLTECPNRGATFDATTTLTWVRGPLPGTCFADWYVTMKNVSARAVDVRHADVKVWGFNTPPIQGRKPVYVSLDSLRPRQVDDYLFQTALRKADDPFINRYSPAAAEDHTFEWLFDTRHSPEWIVFEITLFEDAKGAQRVRHAYEWSAPCAMGEQTPERR